MNTLTIKALRIRSTMFIKISSLLSNQAKQWFTLMIEEFSSLTVIAREYWPLLLLVSKRSFWRRETKWLIWSLSSLEVIIIPLVIWMNLISKLWKEFWLCFRRLTRLPISSLLTFKLLTIWSSSLRFMVRTFRRITSQNTSKSYLMKILMGLKSWLSFTL